MQASTTDVLNVALRVARGLFRLWLVLSVLWVGGVGVATWWTFPPEWPGTPVEKQQETEKPLRFLPGDIDFTGGLFARSKPVEVPKQTDKRNEQRGAADRH
jgi:hypothetical protein